MGDMTKEDARAYAAERGFMRVATKKRQYRSVFLSVGLPFFPEA